MTQPKHKKKHIWSDSFKLNREEDFSLRSFSRRYEKAKTNKKREQLLRDMVFGKGVKE